MPRRIRGERETSNEGRKTINVHPASGGANFVENDKMLPTGLYIRDIQAEGIVSLLV